ncbi:MAG TPA: DUF4190 domain-containing protein [Mycobacteriales bacterium]|jgi:hypothetical protein|nr:DUF4190 domain-containing protein [Mycobacteriales bacterium]
MTTPSDGSFRIGDATSTTPRSGAPEQTFQRTEKTVHHQPAPRPAPAPGPAGLGVETRPARPAKTSAAAAFALVFGISALFCALTALLSPVAVVLGLIGLVLAFVGLKMAKRPGVTGKGVAIGGLVTALLGVLLGGVILGGATAVVNNKSQLDRVQSYLDKARAELPSTDQVRDQLPGQ